ncbi:MAG: S9 family peptidase [Betaproteobacteria bacterium]|nr:S9 family peptidase [Betaproteobacteria bacterium]
MLNKIIVAVAAWCVLAGVAQANDDPYLWLEDVHGEKALSWVREQNARSQALIEGSPGFAPLRDKIHAALSSRDRIPTVQKRGAWLYNFWQDATNVRGIWRRTALAEYRKREPRWETILDLDQLAKEEKENWVWRGLNCRYPEYSQCLLSLSRGGADAVVIREWDLTTRSFVKNGFQLKEAKGSAAWIDADSLFVQTDFGPGSQTRSGYARIVKVWTRGTPVEQARTLFEGRVEDISVNAYQVQQKGYATRQFLRVGTTFFTGENYLVEGSKLTKLDVPADAAFSYWQGRITVRLKSAWTAGGKVFQQGSLLVMPFDRFLRGERDFAVLFEGGERKSLAGTAATKDYFLVNELDNVKNRLFEWKLTEGIWRKREVKTPGLGTLSIAALDADEGDEYFLTMTDFLTPSTLYLAKASSDQREVVKTLPAFFDATPYKVEQFEAVSKDGERIPYFVVMRKDAKFDGRNPTLLYGYGGFEIAQLPAYSPAVGLGWLGQGGVYVVANIRGGGEFGPRWHQAGLKAHRQRVFDDFIAVGEDLVQRRISSPRHLAIAGGSNGGLLVGAVMVQRPDLFRAVVCSVPLLDMRRYHKLLAGASWVAEYGNPDDPGEWDFISKYSPYQNVKSGIKMPKVLFVTSTRDDRVHPGHARKMMARMKEQGHDVLYYENIEGGHSAAANLAQTAYRNALQYTFLINELR